MGRCMHSNGNNTWNFYGLNSVGHICFAFYIKLPRVSDLIFYKSEHLFITGNISIEHYFTFWSHSSWLLIKSVAVLKKQPRLHFSI